MADEENIFHSRGGDVEVFFVSLSYSYYSVERSYDFFSILLCKYNQCQLGKLTIFPIYAKKE